MKGLVGKTALAAAVVAGPIVAISTGTADATPVWGGAEADASPWWQHPQWTNLQIAQAWGPSNLYNEVTAESLHGCVGCTALAVNFQVDLVSYTIHSAERAGRGECDSTKGSVTIRTWPLPQCSSSRLRAV